MQTKAKNNLNYKLIFNLLMHLMMVLIMFTLSLFYVDYLLDQNQIKFFDFSQGSISMFLKKFVYTASQLFYFKILVPLVIFSYFYYCLKKNVFTHIFKNLYEIKYKHHYQKLHKINIPMVQQTQQKKQPQLRQVQQRQNISYLSNPLNKTNLLQQQSQLNLSMQMIKSMSKSMISSIKSIGHSNSLIHNKNNISSNKIIQSITKQNQSRVKGKSLINLWDNKENSKNILNQSSISSQAIKADTRLQIKNKRYFDFVSDQYKEYQKWYELAFQNFTKTALNQKLDKDMPRQSSFMKKGLQIEISNFLREFKQNSDQIKQFLTTNYCLKIQGFQKRINQPYQNIQKPQKKSLQLLRQHIRSSVHTTADIQIAQKVLYQKISSPTEFLKNLNSLKIPLRDIKQKHQIQRQLQILISKKRYFHSLLNVASIQGELSWKSSMHRVKLMEKALKGLPSNRFGLINFANLANNNSFFNQMNVLESLTLQNIKQIVDTRLVLLTYVVNKINTLTSQNKFKVQMKQAVTYDSGYLSAAINLLKNRNFATINCQKGADNIIVHYNLKVHSESKEQMLYCQPGIQNPLSILLLLVKKIQSNLNFQSFQSKQSYEQGQRSQKFKQFINNLYQNDII